MSFLGKIFDGAITEAFQEAGNWLSEKANQLTADEPEISYTMITPDGVEVDAGGVEVPAGCYIQINQVREIKLVVKEKVPETKVGCHEIMVTEVMSEEQREALKIYVQELKRQIPTPEVPVGCYMEMHQALK